MSKVSSSSFRSDILIPLILVHSFQIAEVREFRPAGIGNNDIDAAESADRGVDEFLAIGLLASIADNDGGFDVRVVRLKFFCEVLGRLLVVGVVDGDVGAFSGKLARDSCAEASGVLLENGTAFVVPD